MVRIGVVGDYDPTKETHVATTSALALAGAEAAWLPTDDVPELAPFDGLLIAPGSPYRSTDGALAAITYARTKDVPLLGTCGGFQHLVVEFARNVLGVEDADHGELHPDAPNLFVKALSCSLAGRQMSVTIRPDTVPASAYGVPATTERYYCNFGLNPEHLDELTAGGLRISGVDQDGEVRIIELPGLRFFVATLFVPQTSSTPEHPHPLVASFVRAAAGV